MNKLSDASQFLDISGLDSLRAKAQQDDKGALREVAQQFEGIFVQMLMKSMRDANAVFESDSPMNSQYTKFYEQMHDQQMSVNLSDKGMLGLADLMVQQLSPETSPLTPASVLRGDNSGAPHLIEQQAGFNIPPRASVKANIAEQSTLDSIAAGSLNMAALSGSSVESGQASPNSTSLTQQMDKVVSGSKLASSHVVEKSEFMPVTFADQSDFIKQLQPYAEDAARKLGTSAEVLIAQSALETGWGQKMVKRASGEASNNLFNIKADTRWQGARATVNTLEFEQGVAVQQRADFRVYNDIKQSFDDFVSFISNGERYQEAIKQAGDAKEFIKGLQQAGYATDPNYADKVIKVMQSVTSELSSKVVGE